jgi:hypothetical protein
MHNIERRRTTMPTDLTVYLTDRPGQVAAVSRTLGEAGINIDGGFALVVADQGIMHVLVENGDEAHRALTAAGFEVRQQTEVVVVDCADEPGALGELTTRVADTGINLSVFYVATSTRMVLGADDIAGLREAVAG